MPAPTTPTTADLADNIKSQIEASISQATPLLPKSFVRVLSSAIAAVAIVLYRYAEWLYRQLFPSTADFSQTEILGENVTPLIMWGNLIGVGEPLTGTAAELVFDVTVTNQVGSLPAQTQIVNPSTGIIYLTTSSVLLNAATVQVAAVATIESADGNADAGTSMQFVNPLANVLRAVTVASTNVQGANPESAEAYRNRVVQRLGGRPQGGAAIDYVVWSTENAGIKAIYPYTGLPGQVNVYVEATVASSGSDDGIPTAAQLALVEDSIELLDNGLAGRRPIGAFVNVLPITRTAFNVTISGLGGVSDLAAVQASIAEALDDYFEARQPLIPGVTPLPRADFIIPSAVSGVVEDVVTANGGIFSDVDVATAANPSTFITLYILSEGEKAKVNTVSYA